MRTSFFLSIVLIVTSVEFSFAATLTVGPGQDYSLLEQAAPNAQPGDTILVYEDAYTGVENLNNIQGTANDWIYITAAPGQNVVYTGATEAWHLTNCTYLHISGFTYEQQTGNGVNTDDGGDYSTPTHHIIYENCTFQNMAGTGNNDLLKLSGLDDFEVRNCIFLNGAAGGSGIDMVGCHRGVIQDNYFENMGSNAIQAKGGTQFIRIEGNFFKNAGFRSVNLGGSTGLQFFRPLGTLFEAADLQVYSNVFIGSEAPIAYVGSTRVDVINNTIYMPDKWVVRILQETTDSGFVQCSFNTFRNNIIYLGNSISTETNIGPNTQPSTFSYSSNLWFNVDDASWGGPSIPVIDSNGIINQDPLFADAGNEDFHIPTNSPAVGLGYPVSEPMLDFDDVTFNSPRSAGAFEGNPPVVGIETIEQNAAEIFLFPNPANHFLNIKIANPDKWERIVLLDLNGQKIGEHKLTNSASDFSIDVSGFANGLYVSTAVGKNGARSELFCVSR